MTDEEAVAASIVVMIVVYAVVIVVTYVVTSILLHFLFRKIGVRPWRAWVPIMNMATILQIGGYSGWWALGYLVPGLNIVALVFMYISYYRMGKGLRLDDTLNIVLLLVGFWHIYALVAAKPYDHRLTGVQTTQPDQLEEIAAGRLVDATVVPTAQRQPGSWVAPQQQYGQPQHQQFGQPQQQYGQPQQQYGQPQQPPQPWS